MISKSTTLWMTLKVRYYLRCGPRGLYRLGP